MTATLQRSDGERTFAPDQPPVTGQPNAAAPVVGPILDVFQGAGGSAFALYVSDYNLENVPSATGASRLVLTRLDVVGQPVGPGVILASSTLDPSVPSNRIFEAQAAPLAGGATAVVWRETRETWGVGRDFTLKMQLFDGAGQPLSAAVTVDVQNTPTGGRILDQLDVELLADGSYVVGYARAAGGGAQAPSEVVLRQFLSSGVEIGSADAYPGGIFAMAASGARVGAVIGSNFALLNPDGSLVSSVALQPGAAIDAADVVALAGGGYAVTWAAALVPEGDRDVYVRVFDANGAPVTAPLVASGTSFNWQYEPKVAALRDGGFAVAFTDVSLRSPDATSKVVRVQTFDASGAKVGSDFPVPERLAGEQNSPGLWTLADGPVLLEWQTGEAGIGNVQSTAVLDNRPQALPVSAGADLVVGHGAGTTFADDAVYSGEGADTVFGLGGADWLDGGAGADQLYGGDGNDVLAGDLGADWMMGGAGADTLYGGADADTLQGEAGNGWLDVGAGASNQAYGGAGNDTLFGAAGDDWLDGGSEADQLYGGDGANVLVGGAGADWMVGGAGYDQLYGGADADVMQGLGFADWLDAGAGDNTVLGGEGADTVLAGSGADWLYGGTVDDQLYGGDGANALFGGDGADWMVGGTGYDQLYGGAGGDTLQGGEAGDWIVGGAGADLVFGQGGADTLIASAGELAGDSYADFEAGVDLLSFQGFGAEAQLVHNGPGSYTLVYAGGAELFSVTAGRVLVQGTDYVILT